MKKSSYLILTLCCLLIIIVIIFITKENKLDLNSQEVNELYSYLGEVDLYHCGGLNAYTKDEVKNTDLTNSNKLCMAYYNLNDKDITSNKVESTLVNDNDIKICKVGDNISFITEEGNDCQYEVFSTKVLNEAYKDLYGSDIKKNEEFYISNTQVCYQEGDNYYCGKSETFNVALTSESDIYRLKTKAIKKKNDDIIIYDYFLKISENKCYLSNSTEEESTECSEALAKYNGKFDNESDTNKAKFIKKYGQAYMHTFKLKNDDYYWSKSNKN